MPGPSYDVALSYAGEDREYVQRVADALRKKGVKVFYDKDEEASAWGEDLNTYLRTVFHGQAAFMVMFVSKAYAEKQWPNHERESAQERALREHRAYILPARFDDTEVPGLPDATAYVDLRKKLPEELADLILQKIETRKRQRRNTLIASGLLAAAIVVSAAVWRFWPHPLLQQTAAVSPPPPPLLRHSVAVLSLRDDPPNADAEWLTTAVPEILSRALAAGGTLRVIPRAEVVQMETDLGLDQPGNIAGETLQRIRKRIHADSLVVGSYSLLGDSKLALVQIAPSLLDTKTGRIVAGTPVSVTEGHLVEMVINAANPLREKLGAGELSPTQKIELSASFPSIDGFRPYAAGLGKLFRLEAEPARIFLTQAAAADDHPLIHSALSAACAALGREKEAQQEIQQARARSERLSWDQRTEIEARFYKTRFHDTEEKQKKDWSDAIKQERALQQSAPDAIEYGLRLASSLISADRVDEALVSIETLRRLPPPLSSDGRIDLVEARARQEKSEWDKQQALAASAAQKGRATDDSLLVGNARMLETTALFELGKMKEAGAAINEAQSRYERAGDRSGIARTLEQRAAAIGIGGDLEGESIRLREALALHRKLGDNGGIARVLLNLGYSLVRSGQTKKAQESFDQALTTFRKAGETYAEATAQNEIGAVMFFGGDLRVAEERYRNALSLFEKVPSENGRATALTNIGEVLSCRGNLEGARRLHQESLGINERIRDPKGIAYDRFRLGEIFALQGDPAAARKQFDQALDIQNTVNDPLAAAESKLAIAGLLTDQGQPAEAEKLASEAQKTLQVGLATDRSLFALAEVARALLAQGQKEEASHAADHAWNEVAESEDRQLRFHIAVARARAMAASGNRPDADAAVTFLEPLRADAGRSQFVVSELKIRLAIGEIQMAAGNSAGRERLAAVKQDAEARGIGSIAAQAGKRLRIMR